MVRMGEVGLGQLDAVVDALRGWQHDGASVPLHPGDIGWNWRFGAPATAMALRTWTQNGEILAVGMLDAPGVLRLAIAPDSQDREDLARQMGGDLSDPHGAVLPSGEAVVEARFGGPLRALLLDAGWSADEPWTPLRRDLSGPVEACRMRVEVVGPQEAEIRAAVQRAAFEGSTFTAAHWQAMAAGSPYADARCLLAYCERGTAVATATVWSSGPSRPGLLEPVGVHRDHRLRGYGRAIGLAAAGALRELGSSSATVCTRSANVAAVAAYRSAGFDQLPEVPDLRRPPS
jgi:GNAT superfamily N-acetyltransferase